MNYIDNKVDNRIRNELGNFIGNYKEWDYIVGLSYRNDIRNEKIGRTKVKNLINNLSKYDENIDGVYVNEYDGSFNKIHHHLVVKTNLKEYDFKYRLLQYWKNVGMSEVEKYDSSLGFSYYMSKHIGKTEINNWGFLSNL
tara:strand:+ start:990 stop:1409 length:420 start_codon:yes stop_codon:yes gene_type:complete